MGAVGLLGRCASVPMLASSPSGQSLRGGYYRLPLNYSRNRPYKAANLDTKRVFDWNLSTRRVRSFDVSVATHVVETHPGDTNLSILATKNIDRISLLNWSTGEEVSHFQFASGEYFYGHGAYSDSGKLFIAPAHRGNGSSRLCIFEFPSLKLVDEIQVSRGISHDIVARGKDQFLFTVSAGVGKTAAFGFLDLPGRSVVFQEADVEKIGRDLIVGHLKDCGDRYIANVQIAKNGDLANGSLVSIDKSTQSVRSEISVVNTTIKAEMLSLEYDPVTSYVWISVPNQDQIEVWDMKAGRQVQRLTFPKRTFPTGISSFPGLELVIVTTPTKFLAFNSRTLQRLEKVEEQAPHQVLDKGLLAHSRIV